jgi:hypothetical protein
MALLYGRAGRLTAKNGGFRPGQFKNLTNSWCLTCHYGLGLFKEDQYGVVAKADPAATLLYGHAGQVC